jgi:hypothetical protein
MSDVTPSAAPSRGDRLLLGGLTVVLALCATLSPIRNFDYWWHLKTGALILKTGSVPTSDPFSFTAAGAPWIDHEWLFQVLLYLGHQWIGPTFLVLLKAALCLGLTLLLARHLEREGHGPAGTAFFLTLALTGAAFRIDVRPELATLLLVPLAVHLAMRARDRGRTAPLVAIPILTAFGINLHVGCLLIPVMLGTGVLACLLTAEGRRFAPRLAATALAAALATGINPSGFAIWSVPFQLRALLAALPWPNLEWVPPTLATVPIFFAALAVAVPILVLGVRHLDPIAAPSLILAGLLALGHVRNVGLFCLLMPFGLARPARALVLMAKSRALYRGVTRGELFRPGFVLAALVLVAGIPLLLILPPKVALGVGVGSDNEPKGGVDFLEREGVGRHLYNDVRFGGYLVWRRAPETPVFIDGRNELYGPLMQEISGAMAGPAEWKGLLERHAIDAAFLRYPPTLQKVAWTGADGRPHSGVRAFSVAYFPASDWALVFWDDDAMVFLRRGPDHDSVIARHEYRALNPDDWQFLRASILIGRLDPAPILAEIRRKLDEDPTCARAQALLGQFEPFEAARSSMDQGPDGPHRGGR